MHRHSRGRLTGLLLTRAVVSALLAAAVSLPTVVAGLAPPAGAASALGGPDVASYQHPGRAGISWRLVAGSGQRFAIVKATQGTDYVNPYFQSDWAGARAAGLVRGAYHFAEPALPVSTAVAQAEHFIRTAGTTREQGDLPPILDLEITGGLAPNQLVAWTAAFLDTVRALTGRAAVIYTDPSFWVQAMGDTTDFDAYPLWIADYSGRPSPGPLPGGWPSWTLWQYTDNARIPGIPAIADRSLFCCDAGSLAAFSDGALTPILAAYLRLGGPHGPLGLPLGPQFPVPGGWGQRFQHGEILYSPRTGAHAVTGAVLARYLADGGGPGPLGLPTGDAVAAARRQARLQRFQGGWVVYSAGTGAHAVLAPVLGAWLASGGLRSPDGLPVGELTATASRGRQQVFRAGRFYATPRGTFEVHGDMLASYLRMGGPSGPLGLPTSNAHPNAVGREQDFATGVITYVSALGLVVAG